MRIRITLDKDILGVLQKETGQHSKSKAVLMAIQEYLRRRRLKRVLSKTGTYHFHPQTAEWRHLTQ